MVYISVEEIVTKFPAQVIFNLLNDENRPSVNWNNANDPIRLRLESLMSDAENEINGFLTNYSLPLLPVPPLLSVCALDITIFNCYRRRITNEIPEHIHKTYRERLSLLHKIASGEIALSAATDNPIGFIAVTYTDTNFLEV